MTEGWGWVSVVVGYEPPIGSTGRCRGLEGWEDSALAGFMVANY